MNGLFLCTGSRAKDIKPSLNVSSEYNTNINLSADDKNSSWITYVRLGLSIQAPLENFYKERFI